MAEVSCTRIEIDYEFRAAPGPRGLAAFMRELADELDIVFGVGTSKHITVLELTGCDLKVLAHADA